MSERLSDTEVVWWANARWYDPHAQRNKLTAAALLAREVQEWRSTYIESGDDLRDFLRATDVTQTIDALCARHGITVEGIVALVDEVMKEPNPFFAQYVEYLRRLARREEA